MQAQNVSVRQLTTPLCPQLKAETYLKLPPSALHVQRGREFRTSHSLELTPQVRTQYHLLFSKISNDHSNHGCSKPRRTQNITRPTKALATILVLHSRRLLR